MNKQYFTDCKNLDEAKQLYKKLAFQLHPDVSGRDSTAEFQELQNQFQRFKPGTEKFDGEFDTWNAKEYAHIIDALMQIPNIEIEICGSWIWLSGDTKPVKELIKDIEIGESMKRGFSRDKAKWFFCPKGYRKKGKALGFDRIKNLYGHQSRKSNARKSLQET